MTDRLNPPTYPIPTWATGNYPAGPEAWNGQPKRVTPLADGFTPKGEGGAQHVNDVLAQAFETSQLCKTYDTEIAKWAAVANYQVWRRPDPATATALTAPLCGWYHDESGKEGLYLNCGTSLCVSNAPGHMVKLPAQSTGPVYTPNYGTVTTGLVVCARGNEVIFSGIMSGNQNAPVRVYDLSTGQWVTGNGHHDFGATRYPFVAINVPGGSGGMLLGTADFIPSNAGASSARGLNYFTVNAAQVFRLYKGTGLSWGSALTIPAGFQSVFTNTSAPLRGKVRMDHSGSGVVLAMASSMPDYATNVANAAMMRSTDYGATWSALTMPNPSFSGSVLWAGPVYHPTLGFVVAASQPISYTSPDRWQSKIYTSPDGTTWTQVAGFYGNGTNNPAQQFAIHDLQIGENGVLVAVDLAGGLPVGGGSLYATSVMLSTDGLRWQHAYATSHGASSSGTFPPSLLTFKGPRAMISGNEYHESVPLFGNGFPAGKQVYP